MCLAARHISELRRRVVGAMDTAGPDGPPNPPPRWTSQPQGHFTFSKAAALSQSIFALSGHSSEISVRIEFTADSHDWGPYDRVPIQNNGWSLPPFHSFLRIL